MPPYEKPKTAYDFITKPPTPQKQPNAFAGKVPFLAGGGVALIVLLFVVLSVFTGGSDNETRLVSITQQQTEISRVATLGATESSQATKNIALNAALSTKSDRQKLVAVLGNHGMKIKPKQMSATANAKTDQTLEAAKAAANFDDTFTKTLDEQLADYQISLQEAYKNSGSEDVKNVLSSSFNNAKLLRTQIKENK